jgi:hypothetical protein
VKAGGREPNFRTVVSAEHGGNERFLENCRRASYAFSMCGSAPE